MTEGKPNAIPDCSTIAKGKTSDGSPGSSHIWDFEFGFAVDPFLHSRQIRIRASSWDDSDDNLPPIPDNSGSKTCRIYSSDDKKYRSSVSSEINELKREFFKNLERENEKQGVPLLESAGGETEEKLYFDRRLSPARIRRRSKSSGSSSSAPETEYQISPTKMNQAAELEIEPQEINSNSLEYDPKFYLANFFTELRSRRISLLDSMSLLEILANEGPRSDGESIPLYDSNMDGTDSDVYFCKTTRKLSKILEVEENKKDFEKSSKEKISDSSLSFRYNFQKPEGEISPLQTSRSKKTEKIAEGIHEETAKKEEKQFRSLSSEYLTNFQKPQKLSRENLTDRSARFFDQKLDDDFISLSAKCGKTQLSARKCPNEKQDEPFSPRASKKTDKNCSDQKDENDFNLLKLLKIDLTKGSRSEDTTPRKSTDRSEQSHTTRTKSGKSRKSWHPESPKFMLNIGIDSERSLKLEDVTPADFQTQDKETKPREEESSFEKIIPYELIESPRMEPEISTGKSVQGATTNRSEGESNTQRSHRKKRKQKIDNLNVELETKEPNPTRLAKTPEQHSPIIGSRSSENPQKTCRSKCSSGSVSQEISNICEFDQTPNSKSSRTSKSTKVRTPKTTENRCPDHLSHQGTSRSSKISELSLSHDISGRPESQKAPHRSTDTAKDATEGTKDSDHSESKCRSRRRSEQSSSSRTRNTECSPRSLKMTPRTNSCSSRRSRDSLENSDETGNLLNFPSVSWKEFGKICDTTSNHTSISSASRGSGKEIETPSQQHSWRSEIYNSDQDNSVTMETFQTNNPLTDRLSGSRNSSRTSLDCDATERSDNSSSHRSAKTKSRPNSWTTKELKSVIPPDVEKPDINPISRRTERNFVTEGLEENNSTYGTRIEDESDRFSNKRLSVINEVSFEDIETSNDVWDQHSGRTSPKTPERLPRSVKRTSPKDTPNASGRSSKEKSIDESTELDKGEDWTELISKFQNSGRNFPGFTSRNENPWNSIKSSILEESNFTDCDEISENSNWESVRSKMPEQNIFCPSLDRSVMEKKVLDNPKLVYQKPSLDKTKQSFAPSFQSHQHIHYVSVSKAGGTFGIGEFGDVTGWNPGDSDIKDIEKPKDHGDGIPSPSEILPRKSKKTEREVKNQQLLRDFTYSTPILNKLPLEPHIPCLTLKASKSDNCGGGRVSEERKYNIGAVSSVLNNYKNQPEGFEENVRTNRDVKSSNNTVHQHSSSDSLESERDLEFDYERNPRLSRSLWNLDTRDQQSLFSRERSEILNNSGSEIFKKTPNKCKLNKNSTNLNLIFLERKHKGEKISPKSNWLILKRGKKAKRSLSKKGAVSPNYLFHDYLSSRKTRSSVPALKLSHPNCFRNFYKRFISVFCLTSNSSVATSQ